MALMRSSIATAGQHESTLLEKPSVRLGEHGTGHIEDGAVRPAQPPQNPAPGTCQNLCKTIQMAREPCAHIKAETGLRRQPPETATPQGPPALAPSAGPTWAGPARGRREPALRNKDELFPEA